MEEILWQLALILLSAKILSEFFVRCGQTATIGEIIAGILIGPAVLGLITPSEFMSALATLGVIFMIFMTGLTSNLRELKAVGKEATVMALGGIILSFSLGFVLTWMSRFTLQQSLFIATALSATSIGVSTRVLIELNKVHSKVAEIILGAAVIDDVASLSLLAFVASLTVVGAGDISSALVDMAFFWILVLPFAWFVLPPLVLMAQRMRAEAALLVVSLGLLFSFTFITEYLGLSAIIGAFLFGIILGRHHQSRRISQAVQPMYYFLAPIFFVSVGFMFDLGALSIHMWFTIALIFVAIIGKVGGAGLPGMLLKRDRYQALTVGVGMIPRGEVALVVAALGLSLNILSPALYGALIMTALATIFITPVLLSFLMKRKNEVKG